MLKRISTTRLCPDSCFSVRVQMDGYQIKTAFLQGKLLERNIHEATKRSKYKKIMEAWQMHV